MHPQNTLEEVGLEDTMILVGMLGQLISERGDARGLNQRQ